jgi:hypothetical protein
MEEKIDFWYALLLNGTSDDKIIAKKMIELYERDQK